MQGNKETQESEVEFEEFESAEELFENVFVGAISSHFKGETFDRCLAVFRKFDARYAVSIIELFRHAIYLPSRNGAPLEQREMTQAVNFIEKMLAKLEEFDPNKRTKIWLPHKHTGSEFVMDDVAKLFADIYRDIFHEIPTAGVD